MGDIRQLAGLIEGEGSFSMLGTNGPNRRGYMCRSLVLAVSMSDEDVIRQAAVWLGHDGKIHVYHRLDPRHKTMYGISLHGARAAGWMMTLYSFLGERRRQRIRELLAQWRKLALAHRDKTNCPRGHPYDIIQSGGVKGARRGCSICTSASNKRGYRRRVARALADG